MDDRVRFNALGYAFHLYSGKDALEHLPRELARAGATRALLVCGRSVAAHTNLVERVRALIGDKLAGVYSGIQKDAPLDNVLAAVQAAREQRADLLIAVGAGSVLKAVRIIAILLAETQPLDQLITQYPPGGRAISPKLTAPKLPIINVLTAPTTAQNRAGAALKEGEGTRGQRMEFFDPKTRPCAIFWDADALLTAPPKLALHTGAAIYWRSLMNMGLASTANPLVQGERYQAYRLASGAIRRVCDSSNAEPRIELCAAAFLQNREEDEGRRLSQSHWVARVVYALGASTFHLCEHVGQGEAYAALTASAVRQFGVRDPDAIAAIGEALGASANIDDVAAAFERVYAELGLATRLRDVGVPQDMLPAILQHSLQNFNADAQREFLAETESLAKVLDAAW